MSNHKLTVANLCVKSNSMWTNFADNGKIHTCMYNVCTMYTTAVGVILPRQLACCLHRNEYDIWCNVCWTLVWGSVIGKLFEGKCWRGNVGGKVFGSLRSHGTRFAYGRLRAQALSQPCLVKERWRGVLSVLCLQRMAQLSDLVIWCARNWWMFGATVFCSLRSHGTRLLLTQQSKPCLVMGKAGVCACVVIS